MSEPIRHKASPRNRRKALHNAKALLEELVFLHGEMLKRLTNMKYAIHRANTLTNRLEAEVLKGKKK